jgi:hypothetical protein
VTELLRATGRFIAGVADLDLEPVTFRASLPSRSGTSWTQRYWCVLFRLYQCLTVSSPVASSTPAPVTDSRIRDERMACRPEDEMPVLCGDGFAQGRWLESRGIPAQINSLEFSGFTRQVGLTVAIN